ncbi:U-box domain-containing protein [Legionella genomosp. 1]|uniref:U-box domain-containing protein n=1 Tax=Legionella genomosp. 1 TaxID=1093625 RepID=UPI0010552AFA|nr:U-box domain-containing protein [Legionella genomosp. 1]
MLQNAFIAETSINSFVNKNELKKAIDCVFSTTLKPEHQSTTSSQATSSNVTKISPVYSTGNYEKDLETALANSLKDNNASLASTIGIFAAATKPQGTQKTIPKSFECPITQDVMEEPTIFIVDWQTYELSAIKDALKRDGISPISRKPIPEGKTIEELLIPNLALKHSIEEFKKENPELFDAQGLAIIF